MSESLNADQYFPTYSFDRTKERDIALAEYNSAINVLQSEERLYTYSVNIITLAFSIIGSIFITHFKEIAEFINSSANQKIYIMVCESIFFLTITSLTFITHRHREIVYAARKVIVLRRMLGLSYGRFHLILPNWRAEGADEPFSIRTFEGWSSYKNYPAYIIISLSAGALYFLLTLINQTLLDGVDLILITSLYFLYLLLVYRRLFYDYHENLLLSLSKIAAYPLRVKLVNNFEYVTYRAKLSQLEIRRLQISTEALKKLSIFLEDRTFRSHLGISPRGIIRAIIQYYKDGKRSGGSTITQQLARTLYIRDSKNVICRKIVEILLAFWIESIFSKDDILEMYLSSVRYDRNTSGASQAMKHFFGANIKNVTNAQAFFLIERISNIHSKFLGKKISENLREALSHNILNQDEACEVLKIYERQLNSGIIKLVDGPTIPDIRVSIDKYTTPPNSPKDALH